MVFAMGEPMKALAGGAPPANAGAGADAAAKGGEPEFVFADAAEGELSELGEMIDEEGFGGEIPKGTAIGLSVRIDGPDDASAPDGGAEQTGSVGVQIETPDGQELSPE